MAHAPPQNQTRSHDPTSDDVRDGRRLEAKKAAKTIIIVYTIVGPPVGAFAFLLYHVLAHGGGIAALGQFALIGIFVSYFGTGGWAFTTGLVSAAHYYYRSRFPFWMAIAAPLVSAIVCALVSLPVLVFGKAGDGFGFISRFVSMLINGTMTTTNVKMLGFILGISVVSSLVSWCLLVTIVQPLRQSSWRS